MIWYVWDAKNESVAASYCYRKLAVKESDRLNCGNTELGLRYSVIDDKLRLLIDAPERMRRCLSKARECRHCSGTGKDLSEAVWLSDKILKSHLSGDTA